MFRFVAIYALFGRLWAKKALFWVKTLFFWARKALLHGICYRFIYLNLEIFNYAQNNEFLAKVVNISLTKILWPFLRSPKGCQLLPP